MACVLTSPSQAQILRIEDICHLKGQEENTLIGRGLVIGLPGTGDADPGTLRALQRMLHLMGNQASLEELKNVKNVATVFVTATVPAEGARQGQKLNCTVSAMSAKSLAGGKLILTTLRGPNPVDTTVYALASGMIELDKNGSPTSGKINRGCQLEVDFKNAFSIDGTFTLVLDQHQASFQTAREIEELINDPTATNSGAQATDAGQSAASTPAARAIDQVNIVVKIPNAYATDPISYISLVLDTRINTPASAASVVIDRGNNVIVIGDNVLVGRVGISVGTISVQTGPNAVGPVFILDQNAEPQTTKLNALRDALNSLKVATSDIISIIEAIHAKGGLYGKLIYK
jgi:flagellar P-ring protein precursor FlgI